MYILIAISIICLIFVIIYQPPNVVYSPLNLDTTLAELNQLQPIVQAQQLQEDIDQYKNTLPNYIQNSVDNIKQIIKPQQQPYPIGTIVTTNKQLQENIQLIDGLYILPLFGQTITQDDQYFDILKTNLKLDDNQYVVPNGNDLILKYSNNPSTNSKTLVLPYQKTVGYHENSSQTKQFDELNRLTGAVNQVQQVNQLQSQQSNIYTLDDINNYDYTTNLVINSTIQNPTYFSSNTYQDDQKIFLDIFDKGIKKYFCMIVGYNEQQ